MLLKGVVGGGGVLFFQHSWTSSAIPSDQQDLWCHKSWCKNMCGDNLPIWVNLFLHFSGPLKTTEATP